MSAFQRFIFKERSIILFFVLFMGANLSAVVAQQGYWQQRVSYKMDVNLNVQTNRLTGKQHLEYWNNSADTLQVGS